MDPKELKVLSDHLVFLFLRGIAEGMRNNILALNVARFRAREFLDLEPFTSIEDMQTKITAFVAKYPDFVTVKEYLDSYHSEKKIKGVIDKMQKYIDDKKIDEALTV